MQAASAASYPGDQATPRELLRLANVFRDTAKAIEKLGRAGDPVTRAPFRFNAIHAIELYLNALLLHAGHDGSRIRALKHDLAARAELASKAGLLLRQRTQAHLRSLVDTREYLVSRYAPDVTDSLSQLNRLSATLDEVAAKVAALASQDTPRRA